MKKRSGKETLIIGIDFSNGEDKAVLGVARVGRCDNIRCVNQIIGQEAIEVYERLVTYKETPND